MGKDEILEAISSMSVLELSELVERVHRRALARYGAVDGELLAVALLEEEAGVPLRRGPA